MWSVVSSSRRYIIRTLRCWNWTGGHCDFPDLDWITAFNEPEYARNDWNPIDFNRVSWKVVSTSIIVFKKSIFNTIIAAIQFKKNIAGSIDNTSNVLYVVLRMKWIIRNTTYNKFFCSIFPILLCPIMSVNTSNCISNSYSDRNPLPGEISRRSVLRSDSGRTVAQHR